MPNRIVRDAILDSERYHAVDKVARLAFHELILCADDYGLVPLARVFLRRHTTAFDGLSEPAIVALFSTLMDVDLLRIYRAESGSEFGYIPRFGNSPRAKKPKWPVPPDSICGNEIKDLQRKRVANAKHLRANAPETETGTETETETEKRKEDSSAPASRKTLPTPPFIGDEGMDLIPAGALVAIAPDWELPEAWGKDAERLGWGGGRILKEAERFRQYWVSGKGQGKRRTLKGWRQSWSNWLRKAEAMA